MVSRRSPATSEIEPIPDPHQGDRDADFMRLALDQARLAEAAGEVPIGAIVVRGGQVLGRGYNAPIRSSDPTAHAEILALRDAAKQERNYRLTGAELYCTVEPCLMCLGALLQGRITRLVFGARDGKVGTTDRLEQLRVEGASFNHRLDVEGGVLATESREMLQRFFTERRSE